MAKKLVEFKKVSKTYSISRYKYRRLSESLNDLLIKLITRKKRTLVEEKFWALKNVSFEIKNGDTLGIIGKNGSGKSTVLKSIVGLVPVKSGTITFSGKKITGFSPDKITKGGISLVMEGRQIFPELSVKDNLRVGAFVRADKSGLHKDHEKIFSYFPVLKALIQKMAGRLSGGEQKILAISMALTASPKLLLLDEPSLGLAPLVVDEIFGIIKKISEGGTTVVLVEQNVNMALRVSDYAYILDSGKIVIEDNARNLINNEVVQKSYLG